MMLDVGMTDFDHEPFDEVERMESDGYAESAMESIEEIISTQRVVTRALKEASLTQIHGRAGQK